MEVPGYAEMQRWFTIVADVVIKGAPEAIDDAADLWEAHFRRVAYVAQSLRDGRRNQQQAWDSPAGEAYGAHLESVAKLVDEAEAQLKPVIGMLREASAALKEAQAKVPVPATLHSQVVQLRNRWLLMTPGGNFDAQLRFGKDMLDAAFGDAPQDAERALNTLNGRNHYNVSGVTAPVPSADEKRHTATELGTDTTGPTGDVRRYGPGGPGGGYGGVLTGIPAVTGLDDLDTGADVPGDGFGVGDGADVGTGLAGAGGGLGGIGALGGLGTGGGIGIGGLGEAGGSGLGTGRGIGSGLNPNVAGLGAPVNAAGSRGARPTGMMGPGAAGAGAGQGDGATRSTWLKEQDDIWGLDEVLPPVVFGTDDEDD